MNDLPNDPFGNLSTPGMDRDHFRKLTYSEQVANYIKECILRGELSPGEQLKEVALAEKLSVSRAPIREALQLLTQDGIIVSTAQVGKHVANLTAREIKDSYFTGGVLEGAAVSAALPNYSTEDIQRLEGIVVDMLQLADKNGPVEDFAKLDNTFHGVLFSRIDNKLLIDLCRRSCQGISKFLLYKHWLKIFSPREIHQRHKLILDAIKEGKAAKIEKVIRNHYIDSGARMAQYGADETR